MILNPVQPWMRYGEVNQLPSVDDAVPIETTITSSSAILTTTTTSTSTTPKEEEDDYVWKL